MNATSSSHSLNLVVISLGTLRIALLAHQVLLLAPDDSTTRVGASQETLPETSHDFLHWLGLTDWMQLQSHSDPALSKPIMRLSTRIAGQACSVFRVPNSVELISIRLHELHPLPSLLQTAQPLPGLAALVWHEDQPLFLLDLSRVCVEHDDL